MKAFQLAVILTAYDKATRVINIATANAEKKLRQVRKTSEEAFGKSAQFGAMAAAILVPMGMMTNEAIKFEDKMADVAKVMNITVGSSDFIKAGEQAKDLSVYLGIAGEASAGLMASLAQGGVQASELEEVSKIAGEMGIAFGMAAELSGEKFIKMRNALGSTIAETKKVADSINFLSDSTAASAEQILTFMGQGGASVANTLKMSGQEAAAFGAALISIGKSGEEAGTIMQRFQKGIFNNADMKALFDKAGGGAAGLMAILEKGASLKGDEQFAFFQKFGEYGTAIASMAQNLEQTRKTLGLVNNETAYANSVSKEFANRQSTTAGQLAKLKASLGILMVDLGSVFLPLLNSALKKLMPIVTAIRQWIQDNPRLVKTIAAFAGVIGVIFALASAFYFLKAAVLTVRAAMISLKLAMLAVRGAIIAMKVAMLTNPITALFVIFATIAVAIIMNWDKVKAWFLNFFAWLKSKWDVLVMQVMPFMALPVLLIKKWDTIKTFFGTLWDKIKEVFGNILDYLAGLGQKFFDAGVNIIKSIYEGMKSLAMKPIEVVQDITTKVREYLPFSPAKRGALRDIHRIKLVETIAQSIKPAPLLNAMQNVTASIAGVRGPQPAPIAALSGAGGGGTVQFNVNFSGPASREGADQFMQQLRKYQSEIVRMIENSNDRRNRTKF